MPDGLLLTRDVILEGVSHHDNIPNEKYSRNSTTDYCYNQRRPSHLYKNIKLMLNTQLQIIGVAVMATCLT